ncbi:T9SS type A sorting domain-containing protein [Terrimonas alba]|uniref:T9SS type A sorting domain-containing protein n=1 Tax=Terrimonas alba TaxID=3349636 RepID=UPI0035F31444
MKIQIHRFFVLLICLSFTLVVKSQTGWYEVSSNIVNPPNVTPLYAITKDPAGNIYACFGKGVFKWNGNSWSELGSLNPDSYILTLSSDAGGNIYAGGWFSNNNGRYYVAKWNGSIWSELGTGSSSLNANGPIESITTDAAGNIYAAGSFTNNMAKTYVAKWDGVTWSELGTGVNALNATNVIKSISSDGAGNLYAAGGFTNSSGKPYVAKWNGVSWAELGTGSNALNPNAGILCITTDGSGNVYAAGQFVNNNNKEYVAKWNGTSWEELGTVNAALNADYWIRTLATDAAGNVYAAGDFTDGMHGPYIAKWNGINWTELGAGPGALHANGEISCIITDQLGNVYASGHFTNSNGYRRVVKWNATTNSWTELDSNGEGKLSGDGVRVIATDQGGNVYAAGYLTNGNGRRYVAKWNGSRWAELGNSTSVLNADAWISAIIPDAAGNIYVSGVFKNGNGKTYVAKWDGIAWSELGSGSTAINGNGDINLLVIDAKGYLYAAGYFTNADGNFYVAKWDGTTWSELGGKNSLKTGKPVGALAVDAAGNVYASAYHFNSAGSVYYVTKWDGKTWTELGTSGNTLDSEDPITAIAVDTSGNVYANPTYLDLSSGWHPYITKWNGSTWRQFGKEHGSASFIVSDSLGNIYLGGGNKLSKWNGSRFIELGNLQQGEHIDGIAFDKTGNIYGRGLFKNSDHSFEVAKLDNLFLPEPRILNVSNKCANALPGIARLANLPENATVAITQNDIPVPYDSATLNFEYFTKAITATGDHKIKVTYTNADTITYKDTSYTVTATITPSITISGNVAVELGEPTTITSSATNAGNTPVYQWQEGYLYPTPYWNNIGNFASTLRYTFPGADARLRCIMISNAYCASPDTVISNVLIRDSLYLPVPEILNVSARCGNSLSAKAELANWPKNATVVTVTQDGISLNLDSATRRFEYFTTGITMAGDHLITVTYANSAYTTHKDTIYTVRTTVVPAITISGNTTIMQGQSAHLTSNISNGGVSPIYQWQDSSSAHPYWKDIAAGVAATLTYPSPVIGSKIRCRLTSDADCASPSTLFSNVLSFDVVTAIDIVEPNEYGIKMYPNPASAFLIIDSLKLTDSWQTLDIIGMDGNVVMTAINISGKTSISIDVQTLPRGYYTCLLRKRNGRSLSLKFVKQ